MVWASSAQLSSCHWGTLRYLLLCRYVVKRDIPNAAVTGRKGVRIPQGTCSSSGNGAGRCVVVNTSHKNRISLLHFLFCHVPFQQISGALLAVHPKEAHDSWVLSWAFSSSLLLSSLCWDKSLVVLVIIGHEKSWLLPQGLRSQHDDRHFRKVDNKRN